jgi:hypothetical protein
LVAELRLREIILYAAYSRRLNFATVASWDFDNKDVLERGGIYTLKDLCALTGKLDRAVMGLLTVSADKQWHRYPISPALRKQLTAFKEGRDEQMLRSLSDSLRTQQLGAWRLSSQ